MRKNLLVLVMSAALLFGLAPSAGAESQTVDGTGDIRKMYAANRERSILVKVFGIGQPCDEAHFVHIIVKWGQTAAYKVEAGCYPGNTWAESLYYLSDRSDPETAVEVNCSDWKLTYNADKVFHRALLPRTCIRKAANRVKVLSEGHNYPSAMGGEAGPTKRLARG